MKEKATSKDKDKDKKKVRLSLEDLEVEGKDVKGGVAASRPPGGSTYMCPW